ncbi:NRDE family protein [Haloarchaeobius sp. DYHT-AS-18]|uniref:NRDE family protein n=1 Tax=Haloarchaeobius sp. DYHT-AS-18 TaxID=3446117 RepID=UPI003EB78881
MCTLTIAWRVFDEPVVVAANRDELLSRPARPPSVVERDPVVVAPRDEQAGGTWIGCTDQNLFVGVTNRWVDADLAGERSRGLLVRDALRQPGATAVRDLVEAAVADHEYQGFNLVVADPDDAFLFEWDGELTTTALDPGVHVVVNTGADDSFEIPTHRADIARQQADNARAVRAELHPRDGETAFEWRERAAAVLGDHDFGVCVHDPDGRFGTRSSSLIVLGDTIDYRWADGPPCETEHEPVDLEGQF